MKNHKLWLIAVAFIVAIVMIFIGNVIIIGDHLATIPYLGWTSYIFYGLVILLFFCAFILPAIQLHIAQEIPNLKMDQDEDTDTLKKFALTLAKNCSYIPSHQKRLSHSEGLRKRVNLTGLDRAKLCDVIEKEIETRLNGDLALGVIGINKRIDLWAERVLITTAISQSNKIDSFIVLANNYKMISDIVKASGFRPNAKQMIRLYYNVIVAAIFSYALSDGLNDMDDIHPFDIANDSNVDNIDISDSNSGDESILMGILRKISIPGIAIGSLIDGTSNALLTYRIGFITRSYITEGHRCFNGAKNKHSIRSQAVKDSFKRIPVAIKNCTGQMNDIVANFTSKIL